MLLFVGRVTNNKRIDILIKALPIINKQYKGVKLVVVGDWASSEEYRKTRQFLEEVARENQVRENVIFTGSVPDVLPYYRTADLFVTASEHEGFCMPIVEAMACGIPVIAANASAIPETLGDGGLLFSPGNYAELAQKVTWLLTSEEDYRFWREKGLQRARDFSLERFYARFMSLIDEVINLNKTSQRIEQGWIPLPSIFKSVSWEELQSMADIALRDYRIRSHIPIIGRLIEWIRFQLTVHVKEAYLDPIIERQVMFNYLILKLLYEISQINSGKKEEQ
ncbi:MAG: glycosyltransferase family 4 protein [Candidatus Methanomethylicaceae archaeon]